MVNNTYNMAFHTAVKFEEMLYRIMKFLRRRGARIIVITIGSHGCRDDYNGNLG